LAPPTISAQINQLEGTFGESLFARSGSTRWRLSRVDERQGLNAQSALSELDTNACAE